MGVQILAMSIIDVLEYPPPDCIYEPFHISEEEAELQKLPEDYEIEPMTGREYDSVYVIYCYGRPFPRPPQPRYRYIGKTVYESTNDPKQRKIHYMKGLYWLFFTVRYGDEYYLAYTVSHDTNKWSEPRILFRMFRFGFRFDTFFDNTFLHVAYIEPPEYLKYIMLEPRSDGLIEFYKPPQLIDRTSPQTLSIIVDSNNHPWVLVDWLGGLPPIVYKSRRTDGLWETESGFPIMLEPELIGLLVNTRGQLLPLSDGRVLAIWSAERRRLRARIIRDSSMGPIAYSSSTKVTEWNAVPSFSAVVDKYDRAHIGYISQIENVEDIFWVSYEMFDTSNYQFRDYTEIIQHTLEDASFTHGVMTTLCSSDGRVCLSWFYKRKELLRIIRYEDGHFSSIKKIEDVPEVSYECRPSQSHTITPKGVGYMWHDGYENLYVGFYMVE